MKKGDKPKAKVAAARSSRQTSDSAEPNESATASTTTGRMCIRMYNVGFGDAFLITYPVKAREHRILIDCGSIAGGGHPMRTVLDDLMKRCTDASGGPRIDLIIATHRHKDHISGFADDVWKSVSVGEVWMPWTEDPDDNEACGIRDRQRKLSLALSRTLELSPANSPIERYREAIFNATGNERSMEQLLRGFSGVKKRRFLPRSNEIGEIAETTFLPGLRAHILGPSRSESFIREVDPPAGKSYLGMAEHQQADQAKELLFATRWQLPTSRFERSYSHLCASPTDLQSIRDIDSANDPLLAASLDRAINGTSLVVVLEIDGKYLLMPGDAQWGTWSQILSSPAATRLIAKSSFFKPGHHASHNGTPIEFVESYLPERTPSMVSTRSMSKWPGIPRQPLLDAIGAKHCPVVRSDQIDKVSNSKFRAHGTLFVETEL